MAPNAVDEKNPEEYVLEEFTHQNLKTDKNYVPSIVWSQFIFHSSMHVMGFYGFYLFIFHVKWMTVLWTFILAFLTGEAIITAAHHGYSHRSFKMTKFTQIVMLALECMAGQNSMYTWARDHRLHHKYSDTDADPHNANRGFFFAHVGWIVVTKHPLLKEKSRSIDVSDLRSDKLLMWQRKYFVHLYIIVGLMIPIMVPMYGWNETFANAFFVPYCFRYILVLNITWTINSFAHTFGVKPYDTRIRASHSKLVWWVTLGEGWHNFHHSFPWDYRGTDVGTIGFSTKLMEFLGRWGFFYDLKTASQKVIDGHAKRHGDGTHKSFKEDVKEDVKEEKNSEGLANLLRAVSFDKM